MVLDAHHPPEEVVVVEEAGRHPRLSVVDPVTLARRMADAAHRMVQQRLNEDDEDPFDDELGLRAMHNPDGEDGA
jgi:hypothetical protein